MSDPLPSQIRPAPKGWRLSHFPETFGARAGPYYFREEGAGPGVGFFSEPHHANLGGVVHGGALMSLADMSLFDVAFRDAGEQFRAVTVTLNAEFLRAGPVGEFIQAAGEVTRSGKSVIFVRGLVTANDQNILAFSGSLKRL